MPLIPPLCFPFPNSLLYLWAKLNLNTGDLWLNLSSVSCLGLKQPWEGGIWSWLQEGGGSTLSWCCLPNMYIPTESFFLGMKGGNRSLQCFMLKIDLHPYNSPINPQTGFGKWEDCSKCTFPLSPHDPARVLQQDRMSGTGCNMPFSNCTIQQRNTLA